MPDLAARCSKSCAGFTARMPFLSRLSRTNSTVRLATMLETCVRIGPGAFLHYRKPRKKTAKAEFTSAFIGLLIRRLESLRPSGSELRIRARVHAAALTESQRDPKKVRRGEGGIRSCALRESEDFGSTAVRCPYEPAGPLSLVVVVVNFGFCSSNVSVN